MRRRILVRNHGPVPDNAIKALAASLKCAQETGTGLIHLIVPAKSSFSGTVISDLFTKAATSSLLKGDVVSLKDGVSIKLESPDTAKKLNNISVAFAAYISGKDMRSVDSLNNVNGIVFLPWISEVGEGWQQSWRAEVFGEKLPEDELNLHPDLEAALNSLTTRINLSTGFSHPSDLNAAKEMFRTLNDGAIPYEPSDMRSWALRNGWRPDFAEDLYELAQKSKLG